MIQVPQQLQVVTGEVAGTTSSASSVIGSSSGTLFSVVEGGRSFSFAPVLAPLEQQIIVDPMLTSELRYGDLWSMREFNHFDFELNGIIRAFLRTAVNDFMDSVHHIWCPLSSQEYQDLPDGAETTLTFMMPFVRKCSLSIGKVITA
ncbi:hypothetical protein ACKU4M_027480 [Klebsiella pneumoniae]